MNTKITGSFLVRTFFVKWWEKCNVPQSILKIVVPEWIKKQGKTKLLEVNSQSTFLAQKSHANALLASNYDVKGGINVQVQNRP